VSDEARVRHVGPRRSPEGIACIAQRRRRAVVVAPRNRPEKEGSKKQPLASAPPHGRSGHRLIGRRAAAQSCRARLQRRAMLGVNAARDVGGIVPPRPCPHRRRPSCTRRTTNRLLPWARPTHEAIVVRRERASELARQTRAAPPIPLRAKRKHRLVKDGGGREVDAECRSCGARCGKCCSRARSGGPWWWRASPVSSITQW